MDKYLTQRNFKYISNYTKGISDISCFKFYFEKGLTFDVKVRTVVAKI